MSEPTPIDLAAIRARADAATEGAWLVRDGEVWVTWGSEYAHDCLAVLPIWALGDAEFIAHARTDVPALLAEVERLQAENAGLREVAAKVTTWTEAHLRQDARRALGPRVHTPDQVAFVADLPVHPADPADCPVCRHALGLPEPATLVLSPEIWCDVCGAWHIPTSCSADVVHLMRDEQGLTACCGRTPFELPRTDRMTFDPALRTCGVDAAGEPRIGPRAAHGASLGESNTPHAGDAPQVPLLDEWCRRHEDNDARPIGPPFTMPKTQEAQS